ncbi:MAG: DUF2341 domain-containing protein [Caldisericum exile]|uniref:DUF2341 domain-containing protein n=1 Tax=Caldisericum exile TaxID=693075 RepID=UPI003C776CCF
MGWLSGFSYRKSHVVNSANNAGTNYQIKIVAHYGTGTDSGADVYLNSHCRNDFGDVRFTDDDGSTLLDYWMEEKVDSDYAVFWVEVADDLSSANATIYIYYGNSNATTTSNGDNTFIFGDDFSGTTLNTNKWTEVGTGTITVSNGYIRIKTTTSWGHKRIMELADRDLADKRIIIRWRPIAETAHTNQIYYAASTLSPDLWSCFRLASLDKYQLYTRQGGTSSSRWISTNLYPLNTWYKLHLLIKSSTLKIVSYNDNYTVRDESTFIAYDSGISRFQIGQGDLNDEGDFDYVWIGKFVDPEPSHGSWGSEERLAQAIVRVFTDMLGMLDVKVKNVCKRFIDKIGMLDVKVKNAIRNFSDVLGELDVLIPIKARLRQLTDYMGMLDSKVKVASKRFMDYLGLGDVKLKRIIKVLKDNLGLMDVKAKQVAKMLKDNLGLADVKIKGAIKMLKDALGQYDALFTRKISAGGQAIIRVLEDILGLVDVKVKGINKNFVDYIGLVDVKVKSVSKIFIDNIELCDVKIKFVCRKFIDYVGLVDAKVRFIVRNIIDYLALSDVKFKLKHVTRMFLEKLALYDKRYILPKLYGIFKYRKKEHPKQEVTVES